MDLLLKLLLLPLAHAIMIYARHRFRKSIKNGDIIGVRFGDAVLNRTVYRKNDDSVIALNYTARNYEEHTLDNVYMPDSKASADVSGDLQELS